MKRTTPSERARRRKASPEEAAYLDLVRTAEMLSHPLAQLLKTEDVSPPQYNILRILRGGSEGLTCGQIASRVVTHDPDITRLLGRLEKRKLIVRGRGDKDRRVVLTRISPGGLELLARLDQPVRDRHHRLLGHLGGERLEALAKLLEACRGRRLRSASLSNSSTLDTRKTQGQSFKKARRHLSKVCGPLPSSEVWHCSTLSRTGKSRSQNS